jgi:cell division septation protein DedD
MYTHECVVQSPGVAGHTRDGADDGFHEIQLSGKQLVFLFMAATVASVVVFLCGVLVGRGVRDERSTLESMLSDAATDLTPAAVDAPPDAAAQGTTLEPPTAEDLSYFNRLEQPNLPPEDLKPNVAPAPRPNPAPPEPASAKVAPPPLPAPAKPASPAPAAAAAPAPPPPAPATAPAPKPTETTAKLPVPEPPAQPADGTALSGAKPGYVVQLAALNSRTEADAMANRLASKGYAAFVLDPAQGTPQVYRVRVGTFSTRREADTIAAKLQKEEQFKPWVTR